MSHNQGHINPVGVRINLGSRSSLQIFLLLSLTIRLYVSYKPQSTCYTIAQHAYELSVALYYPIALIEAAGKYAQFGGSW